MLADDSWFHPATPSGTYGTYGAYGGGAAKTARKLLATVPLPPLLLENIFKGPVGTYGGQYGNGQYGK